MVIEIPEAKTPNQDKKIKQAIRALRGLGAHSVKEETYGIERLLARLSDDDKELIKKNLGNVVCTQVLHCKCSSCSVSKPSPDCIQKLGDYLLTKGPKKRI